jgi:ketosteroid isomerase-like protein
MGTLKFSSLEIRLLGADHASVLGQWDLSRKLEGGGDAGGWFTLLFRRTPAGWRIVHDHTSTRSR